MKRFRRAANDLDEAANQFFNSSDNKSAQTAKVMSLLSKLEFIDNRGEMLNIFRQLIQPEFNEFFNKNYIVPEFHSFDDVVLEGKGWLNYYQALAFEKDPMTFNKYISEAAMSFFDMGYCPLRYERIERVNWETTNVQMALLCTAMGEEALGNYYVELNDEKKANVHLEGAIFSYSNIEEPTYRQRARALGRRRLSLKMERSCWICGARVRGYNSRFKFVCTNLSERSKDFFKIILEQRRKIIPQLNPESIYSTDEDNDLITDLAVRTNFLHPGKKGVYVSICKACESVINELADITTELRIIPIRNELALQSQRLSNLEASVDILIHEVEKIDHAVRALIKNFDILKDKV